VLNPDDRAALVELAPVLRRAVALDPRSLARLRLDPEFATVLVRLPFGVLVSRTIAGSPRARSVDVTVRAADAIAWLDAAPLAAPLAEPGAESDAAPSAPSPPPAHDAEWRTGLPPATGWRRIETVPDDVVRNLVRAGALALKDAAAREGVPGAQPRAEVADALLDSTVLTVSEDGGPATAAVTLRALSALVRMAFLPRGGAVHIDTMGRWIRVVAEFGTVYLERADQMLSLR
jgi:hypothetical protein